MPEESFVSLTVYNMLGQRVAELVNELNQAGVHEVYFDASQLSSGVYYYKLETPGFTSVKKMMLIK